jgi:hypothetical protein
MCIQHYTVSITPDIYFEWDTHTDPCVDMGANLEKIMNNLEVTSGGSCVQRGHSSGSLKEITCL